jgi:hypothetical protein
MEHRLDRISFISFSLSARAYLRDALAPRRYDGRPIAVRVIVCNRVSLTWQYPADILIAQRFPNFDGQDRSPFLLRSVVHHIRGGQTHRLRLAALLTMIERSTMSSLWHKTPLPDYMVRGHTHHYTDTEVTYATRAFTVPCWQLPTEFATKIAADQMPHIGAVIIRNGAVEVIRYPILKADRLYPVVKVAHGKV